MKPSQYGGDIIDVRQPSHQQSRQNQQQMRHSASTSGVMPANEQATTSNRDMDPAKLQVFNQSPKRPNNNNNGGIQPINKSSNVSASSHKMVRKTTPTVSKSNIKLLGPQTQANVLTGGMQNQLTQGSLTQRLNVTSGRSNNPSNVGSNNTTHLAETSSYQDTLNSSQQPPQKMTSHVTKQTSTPNVSSFLKMKPQDQIKTTIHQPSLPTPQQTTLQTLLTSSQDNTADKFKALKDENQKLKELLKKSEGLIESRLAESKLEQQQITTICNLMGPLIQAFNHYQSNNDSKPQKLYQPPKSFQELIQQLDDLNKQMKSGNLMMVGSRPSIEEVEGMRSMNEDLLDEIEKMTQNQLKREAEWVHLAHQMKQEIRELRAFKSQTIAWYIEASTSDLNDKLDDLLPSHLRILSTEISLNEERSSVQQMEVSNYQAKNLIVQQQPQVQVQFKPSTHNKSSPTQSDRKDISSQLQQTTNRLLKLQQAEQRNLTPPPPSQNIGLANNLLKPSQGDFSAGDSCANQKKAPNQQQGITLNNMKGLHAHQQQNINQEIENRANFEGKEEESANAKRDDRKTSFSPSIFVRKYLPFFK